MVNNILKSHFNKKFFFFLFLSLLIMSCAQRVIKPSNKDEKAELFYGYGTNGLYKKEYTKALKYLTKSNRLVPGKSKVLNNLGMAYYFKGKKTKAINYIKKSIKIDQKNTDALLNLATIYMSQKKYKLAKKNYYAVLDNLEYSGQFRVHFNLGLLYLKTHQINKANKSFLQSINDNKNYCPSYFQLGLISYNSNNFKEAKNYFHKSQLGECVKNVAPKFYQAKSMVKLRQYNLAEQEFIEIIKKFPNTKEKKLALKELRTLAATMKKNPVQKLSADELIKNELIKKFEKIRTESLKEQKKKTKMNVESVNF